MAGIIFFYFIGNTATDVRRGTPPRPLLLQICFVLNSFLDVKIKQTGTDQRIKKFLMSLRDIVFIILEITHLLQYQGIVTSIISNIKK